MHHTLFLYNSSQGGGSDVWVGDEGALVLLDGRGAAAAEAEHVAHRLHWIRPAGERSGSLMLINVHLLMFINVH